MARLTGLEPATSGLTARCSNQLSYSPMAPATGLEPVTSRLTAGRYCQLSYAGMESQRFAVRSGPGALPAFVAGTGLEPAHLRLMRPAPYPAWLPRSSGDGSRTRNPRLERPVAFTNFAHTAVIPAGLEPATSWLRTRCSTR
jgi:hypothetical protein